MKNLFKKENLTEWIALPLLILCILLVVLIHGNTGLSHPAPAMDSFYLLKPDRVEEESADGYLGVRRVYTYTLPDLSYAAATGARLMGFLRHSYADCSIEDEDYRFVLRETDTPHIGKTPGKYWLNLPLRPEYSGKQIRLALTPVYPNVRNDNPELMIIRRDTLITMIEMPRDGFLLALGTLAVIIGLIMAVLILFIPVGSREKRLVFCIGAVTVAAGLWKISDLPVLFLLLDYLGLQKEIWFGGVACYLLMLVLSLGTMLHLVPEEKNRVWKICFCVSAAAAAALILLQIFGVLELQRAVVWFGLFAGLLHLYALLRQRSGPREWLWILPFFLTLTADLVINWITGSMRLSFMFLLWTLLNLLLRGVGFVRAAVNRERMLRQKEEELHNARIQAMLSRIQPHFIHNTLSSVYVLCREDPEKAAQVVSDFSDYLQANLSAVAASDLIPFTEELRHTQAYLAVESALYGEQLVIEYDTPFTAFRLPPLTLQPLVENAVKHGIGKGRDSGHIVIRSRAEGDRALVSVVDDGPGFSAPADGDSHIGLANVRERLETLCGGTLTVFSAREGGTVATLSVPLGS